MRDLTNYVKHITSLHEWNPEEKTIVHCTIDRFEALLKVEDNKSKSRFEMDNFQKKNNMNNDERLRQKKDSNFNWRKKKDESPNNPFDRTTRYYREPNKSRDSISEHRKDSQSTVIQEMKDLSLHNRQRVNSKDNPKNSYPGAGRN